MKYMGSKRVMLYNGLGELILRRAKYVDRVADLFSGSGSVAWFAAQETRKPVVASDIQDYAVIMAKAVVERTAAIEPSTLETNWLKRATERRANSRLWRSAQELCESDIGIGRLVQRAKALCAEPSRVGPIWNAYGGHYFSPVQALTFDYLLRYLPQREPNRSVCLASTIVSAGKCAAAPGHTAQPFKPTRTAGPFLVDAWHKSPLEYCRKALRDICPRYAEIPGEARKSDAIEMAELLGSRDLVFVDPPYSAVQYSRFYHVLETVARGKCSPVAGVGRYPPIEDRPQSRYSNKSQAEEELENLLWILSEVGATVIFTFPQGDCSNGLSGEGVIDVASDWFNVTPAPVGGVFSTLGGNNLLRDARQPSNELILLMRPKRRRRS